MKVTRIVKKDVRNVIIYFENDEKLILAFDVFMKSGLRKNDEISGDRFSSLIEENIKYHIKQRAFRYLGRRLHSESELRTKLMQKGYEKKFINEILNDLKRNSYIDDKEFAKVFAEEKLKRKQWSEKKLKSELIKKGVNADIITEVLQSKISDEANLNNAFIVASKKYGSLNKRGIESELIRQKLITFLQSRGYDYDIIKQVCDKLCT